jgi:hypothetical protein
VADEQVEADLRLRRFNDEAAVQLGRDAHEERAGSGWGRQRFREGFAVGTHVLGHVLDQVADAGYRLSAD